MAIPAFGLGTFRLKDDVVIASVKRRWNWDIVRLIPLRFMITKPLLAGYRRKRCAA